MRSPAEIERARRHFREVFEKARSYENGRPVGTVTEIMLCGIIHDALGWALGLDEPADPRLPLFRDLIRQLDAAEGNTPN